MIKHLLLLGALVAPCTMFATDYYVTPEGAGQKDGSTWENAMGLTELMGKLSWNKTNDDHTDNVYNLSTGDYIFTQTGFIFNSGLTLKGGYDATTGELATTGRTVFNGNGQARSNGALFLQPNTVQDETGKKRTITISNIDFENFVANGVWRDGNATNWNYGYASALYIVKCGYAEITDCNFRNNKCTATGTYKDDNIKENNAATTQDKVMAGAVSLNRVNAIFRNCTFTGNTGTQGGAVKLFYCMGGAVTKNLYTTFDGCYFANNSTDDSGSAIMGRHTMQVNLINTTIVDNNAEKNGGAIYMNGPGFYENVLNVVSSTIAGNNATTGSQIFTNGNGVLNVANSIIVADGGADAIADASATSGYKFQGNNLIGKVAEGYASAESDNISDDNNYETVFGDNGIAADGTITPEKYWSGMAPADIAAIVTEEAWPFAVDAAVDQLGNARSTSTSNGALATSDTTNSIEVIADTEAENGDEAWYNLQGMRMAERPAAKGIYIHKGRKVLVR